jgi:AraC-like DNA-binding protein
MGAVLSQFLLAVAGNAPGCRLQDLDTLGAMAVELAVSCLLQQLGADAEPPAAARAHMLLRRIDAFIDQNLADPDLTPRAVAEHHHISLRRLYTLFQESAPGGEGVAASIRRRRLERCRADLARPQLRHHPVHAIAARWGFPNAPAFSRAFRAAYGTTPQAYRAAAAQPGLPGRR